VRHEEVGRGRLLHREPLTAGESRSSPDAQRTPDGKSSRTSATQPRANVRRLQQRNAFRVAGHREDVHDAERKCDPLRSAALRRRNRPLTCGDAVLGDSGRRSGVAGLCESKRAHSEPSGQRAPAIANDRKPGSRPDPAEMPRRLDCPQRTDRDYLGSGTSMQPIRAL